MIVVAVVLDGRLRTHLDEPDDFGAFHVAVSGDADALAHLADDGAMSPPAADGHTFVRIDALRRWAGDAATPEWDRGLVAMIDFAATHGWLSAEGDSIRAHLEVNGGRGR